VTNPPKQQADKSEGKLEVLKVIAHRRDARMKSDVKKQVSLSVESGFF
jgi:hypothetical protein